MKARAKVMMYAGVDSTFPPNFYGTLVGKVTADQNMTVLTAEQVSMREILVEVEFEVPDNQFNDIRKARVFRTQDL